MLVCPVCQSPLEPNGKNLSCEKNHGFDQAKQGYFNLLLNTAKNSQSPGDNAAMVKSRQAFLDSGLYKSISDAVNQLVIDHLWQNKSAQILDLACGEGYYTQQLHHALDDHQINHTLYGLDISKDAIKAGAKRDRSIKWIVANGFKAPFVPHSLDCVINMFNRVNSKTLHALCHPAGKVIIASAAKFHLEQLKHAIYETPKFEEFDMVGAMSDEFEHDVRNQLDFKVTLTPENTKALLGMTPHAWRSSPETQQQLIDNPQLELRVNVNIDCFTPKVIENTENIKTALDEIHTESKADINTPETFEPAATEQDKSTESTLSSNVDTDTQAVPHANQGIWKTKH